PTERAEFSNSTSADLFISIHCDSFPSNADVYGTRVYYADGTPNSTEFDYKISKAVGDAINARFAGGKEVILKPMDSSSAYTVLYKTTAPSVLIECGFITNKSDAEKLIDSEWQNEFASAIANGVDTYFAH
ncbi:MAG: N-acetylmuramoyl-L-alanine amidase, partial [Clostridia bacterium]|nr:N-acetylmuramoyl-L-alanine amidase [Clostridia bacterium]